MSSTRMDVNCPRCGSRVVATLSDFAAGRTKTCSRGHRVELVDQGGGARQADRAMRDLDRELKKLSRTIKF